MSPDYLNEAARAVTLSLPIKPWIAVPFLDLLFDFSRVRNVHACGSLPVSLPKDFAISNHCIRPPKVDDPEKSFERITKLVTGKTWSQDHVRHVSLTSARGWSVYFPCIDAEDPDELENASIFVERGVPSRGGVRGTRVEDGDHRIVSRCLERKSSRKRQSWTPGVSGRGSVQRAKRRSG